MTSPDTLGHYAILTSMLAPAFFLTATASLLMSANARLARVIDRARPRPGPTGCTRKQCRV